MSVLLSLVLSAVLPGESDMKPALSPFPFPDRLSAFVWRNWGLVPVGRLASVVGVTPEQMNEVAGQMGLLPDPLVRNDSRIGFESSNQYFFVPRDLLEKVLTCRRNLDKAEKGGR